MKCSLSALGASGGHRQGRQHGGLSDLAPWRLRLQVVVGGGGPGACPRVCPSAGRLRCRGTKRSHAPSPGRSWGWLPAVAGRSHGPPSAVAVSARAKPRTLAAHQLNDAGVTCDLVHHVLSRVTSALTWEDLLRFESSISEKLNAVSDIDLMNISGTAPIALGRPQSVTIWMSVTPIYQSHGCLSAFFVVANMPQTGSDVWPL